MTELRTSAGQYCSEREISIYLLTPIWNSFLAVRVTWENFSVR